MYDMTMTLDSVKSPVNHPIAPRVVAKLDDRPALFREALGKVLRAVRTESGRTLRDVAEDARVSPGYLSELERGRKEASSELLAAISGALSISLSEILIRVVGELAADSVPAQSVLAS